MKTQGEGNLQFPIKTGIVQGLATARAFEA
jgi:hypothetical protein